MAFAATSRMQTALQGSVVGVKAGLTDEAIDAARRTEQRGGELKKWPGDRSSDTP